MRLVLLNADVPWVRIEPGLSGPAAGRAAIRVVLAGTGASGFLEVALLLTSELVTNALTHTSDGCSLRVAMIGSSLLRVEVHDSSEDLPVLTDAAERPLGGYGLPVVDRLATRWGSERTPHGKLVWYELEG
jgi:hypothetical protein